MTASKVVDIDRSLYVARNSGDLPPNSGGNGGDGDMDERVRKLEAGLTRIEAILPTLATSAELAKLRGDIHEALHAQTWKLIGVAGALVAATYFIAKHIS